MVLLIFPCSVLCFSFARQLVTALDFSFNWQPKGKHYMTNTTQFEFFLGLCFVVTAQFGEKIALKIFTHTHMEYASTHQCRQ